MQVHSRIHHVARRYRLMYTVIDFACGDHNFPNLGSTPVCSGFETTDFSPTWVQSRYVLCVPTTNMSEGLA